ncbi:AMP-binding protein [Brevibacillus marinus]|uniref:AMP-binding protein n=1 Tax=Brevibacillus marinus TaxID=2496837 RepID=UPI0013E065E1|nr:AMP-binding protein [Brevibacillus marinus]
MIKDEWLQIISDGMIIHRILAKHAVERPEAPAIQWQTERPVTYAELYEATCRIAGNLRGMGVKADDRVLVMLPNSLEILYSWFAINLAGAVEVPINIHYKGAYLVHEANDCEARIAIVHSQYLDRFVETEADLRFLERIVVVDGKAECSSSKWRFDSWEDLQKQPAEGFLPVGRTVRDTQAIMYTSGTTGPSKGVVMPYGLCNVFAAGVFYAGNLTEHDVSYVCLPLFHANAQFMQVLPTLYVGGKVSVWPSFSASNWLKQIRDCGATVTNTLGVMCEFVFRQPRREDDANNPLRVMITLPAPRDIAEEFERRFGVKCLEGYGMTEMGVVTYRRWDEPLRAGSAGRALPWFDVRIVDAETDVPLGPNETGEIVVRPHFPWTFMKEYHKVPDKTVEAWRNLWFHTGDSGKMDEEGYLYFVDRLKDAIRRRGENISSHMIEGIVNAHPLVEESAAVAVPSDYGAGAEDEVKLCVVLKSGAKLSPQELLRYCEQNMPYFAVPRYIEYVEELPKTANQKIRKVALRERGITEQTWDREKAGFSDRFRLKSQNR